MISYSHRHKYITTAALVVFTAIATVQSQGISAEENRTLPALDENAGVDDYLRYAALNNAGLEADFNRWKAALERVPQAKSLPDPRFNYTYYIEEVETRVGPQQQKFGLAQRFPWFGKRKLRADAATQAANAVEAVYEQNKLRLFYSVESAYHEYWFLARSIEITKGHIKLVTNLEGVARTRFKTGSGSNSAVIRAQVELGRLNDRLRSLEMLREPIVAKLNAALSRPALMPLPWPKSLPENGLVFSDVQALQWLADNSPELHRLDYLSDKEEIGIRLAKRNYYPDITVGVDYVDTGDALDPGMDGSGKDPVMAMVSINVPLWFGKYRAAEREAGLRKTAFDEIREDRGNTLEAELKLSLYNFRDAARKIDLYRDTLVPKAEQSLKVTQKGFEAGSTGFIALIDAQRMLLEFQLSYRRAQADRGTKFAEIKMITGGMN